MNLLSYKHGVSIIIDEVTYELKESIEDWPFETKLIEFKTFEGGRGWVNFSCTIV